jgi:hypothetical protein
MNVFETKTPEQNLEFRKKLRSILIKVENGDVREAQTAYFRIKELLEEEGLATNCFVGEDMKEGDDKTVRWYAGQFLEIVEKNSWYAMNSYLNCMDRFCPKVSGKWTVTK